MPRVMSEGEILVANSSGYECLSLHTPSQMRCIYDKDTVRMVPPDNGIVPLSFPVVFSSGVAFLPINAAPWLGLLNLQTGQPYVLPPSIPPTAKIFCIDVSQDESEIGIGFDDSALGFYHYALPAFTLKPMPTVLPGAPAVKMSFGPGYYAMVHQVPPYLTVYRRSDLSKVAIATPPTTPQFSCLLGSGFLLTCGQAPDSMCYYDTSTWAKLDMGVVPNATLRNLSFAYNKIAYVTTDNRLGCFDQGAFVWATLPANAATYLGPNGAFGVRWLDKDTTLIYGSAGYILIYNWVSNTCEVYPTNGKNWTGGHVQRSTTRRRIEGTVMFQTDPLDRRVTAINRLTGEFIATTVSDGSNGSFRLTTYTDDAAVVLCSGYDLELTKLIDNVFPTTW